VPRVPPGGCPDNDDIGGAERRRSSKSGFAAFIGLDGNDSSEIKLAADSQSWRTSDPGGLIQIGAEQPLSLAYRQNFVCLCGNPLHESPLKAYQQGIVRGSQKTVRVGVDHLAGPQRHGTGVAPGPMTRKIAPCSWGEYAPAAMKPTASILVPTETGVGCAVRMYAPSLPFCAYNAPSML